MYEHTYEYPTLTMNGLFQEYFLVYILLVNACLFEYSNKQSLQLVLVT